MICYLVCVKQHTKYGSQMSAKNIVNKYSILNKEVSSPPFLGSLRVDCAKFTKPVSVSV